MIQFLAAAALFWAPQATTPYSHGDPTNDEQYVLEIINRARANPTAEGTRLGIDITQNYPTTDPALSPVGARPPLALNARLREAARKHCEAMYTNAFFAHTNPITGSTFDSRITAEGYVWNRCGENIAAGGSSTAVQLEDLLMRDDQVVGRGHRVNLLDITTGSYYREIGIYYYQGASAKTVNIDGTDYQLKDFMTQDFGRSSDGPFLVGVVYNDFNNNFFYDPGEGISGVTVRPATGTYYAVTSSSGGYAIPVTSAGTFLVTFTVGASNIVLSATVGADNVKLDYDIAHPPASVDTDGDGMPNTWETANAFDPNNPADAAQDADSDGRTNLQEYQGGSNPHDANSPSSDTDGDGMPNTWETTYGLNPNSAADAALDNDSDGYTNLQEYQAGTNPTVPNTPPPSADTDSDGMSNTWETNNGFDPNNPADAAQDADGDGYTNLQEYLAGTNPRSTASFPGSGGTARAGRDGANGDNGINDACWGSVGAAGIPGLWNLLLLAGIGILAGRKARRL
jgi:hypothetical protein